MKKIFKITVIAILMFIFPIVAKANSISKIDMDIYVDDDGTAHVTETWSAYLDEGTEGYKPYYNLGNANITNFNVSEDGKTYQYDYFWYSSRSFDSKAYKNGINYIEDGLELCWGISKYGYHNYVLTYDIEGFVATNEDSDMIYWTLIPHGLSSKPDDVRIKIYANDDFDKKLPVWGYGNYGGTAYVSNGNIIMNSDGDLKSDEYMTILVKFDKGKFNTPNVIEQDFDYYLNMAEKDAIHYKQIKQQNRKNNILLLLLCCIISIGSIILYIILTNSSLKSLLITKIGSYNISHGNKGKKISKTIPLYRDIPFKKDIYKAFWIAEAYDLNSNKTDFFGAILLKWIMEKKITIKKTMVKNEEKSVIVLNPNNSFNNEQENRLYKLMCRASKNGVIVPKEFRKWCKKNYNKIINWLNGVLDNFSKKLIFNDLIIKKKLVKNIIYRYKVYTIEDPLYDDACVLKGFKNFLNDFSEIDEKEAIEVKMWEYYLIYAQILGIADKVEKQFEKLYPQILEEPSYKQIYKDMIFVQNLSRSGISNAVSYRRKSQRYSSSGSYSSGGGGFSSGGGGGGSFGGGGGGGGFR